VHELRVSRVCERDRVALCVRSSPLVRLVVSCEYFKTAKIKQKKKMPYTKLFALQMLVQQAQTFVMKNFVEFLIPHGIDCPALNVSQEPDGKGTVKVVISFILDASKDAGGLCTKTDDERIISKFSESLLDNTTIAAASPTITTFLDSHGENLFSGGFSSIVI
jgi:hypothetical protein